MAPAAAIAITVTASVPVAVATSTGVPVPATVSIAAAAGTAVATTAGIAASVECARASRTASGGAGPVARRDGVVGSASTTGIAGHPSATPTACAATARRDGRHDRGDLAVERTDARAQPARADECDKAEQRHQGGILDEVLALGASKHWSERAHGRRVSRHPSRTQVCINTANAHAVSRAPPLCVGDPTR